MAWEDGEYTLREGVSQAAERSQVSGRTEQAGLRAAVAVCRFEGSMVLIRFSGCMSRGWNLASHQFRNEAFGDFGRNARAAEGQRPAFVEDRLGLMQRRQI